MLELAFFLACCWAVARGWDNTSKAVRARTKAARARTPDPHKRRAARQAATGFWVGEALHLFPRMRNGMAAGWHDHQAARGQHQVDTARRKAEHRERQVTWQAEIASYLHRLEIAAQQYRDGPSMSDQLRAAVAAMRKRLGDSDPEPEPEPPPGPAEQNGHQPQPAPPDDDHKPGGKPVTTPSGNGSGGGGDLNYEQVNELCDQALQEAEAASAVSIEACTKIADGLGGIHKVRENSDLMGKAHELASAARDFERARKRMLDAAQATKDQNTQDYGGQQDAADASGKPLNEYVEH